MESMVRQETVTFHGYTFTKDLKPNEQICPTCKGVGLTVYTYPFGLYGEKPDREIHWFNNRGVNLCPDCYGGIQKVCEHCREGYNVECHCEGAKADHQEREQQKYGEKVAKAENLTFDQAGAAGIGLLWCEGLERFLDWDELEEVLREEPGSVGDIWATKPTYFSIDASDLIDSTCENQELHEGAADNFDKAARKELQALLDQWVANHGKYATTYHPDYKRLIVKPQPASVE